MSSWLASVMVEEDYAWREEREVGLRFVQVDAFACAPFTGNPAAVFVVDGPLDEAWMQSVAREMNLSETAFVQPEGEGYRLRWFTPEAEVELCGHATLAAAHALWEEGHLPAAETARFETLSGPLHAEKDGSLIWLDFPVTAVEPTPGSTAVVTALGGDAVFVGRSKFDYLVELSGEQELRALAPDMSALAALEARGVIVTAGAQDYDFVSRFFAPALGVPEDPVTGSAHCALAPYWAAKLGKRELHAFQVSPRGGEVRVVLQGERVRLGGQAITVLRGELAT